MKEAKVRLSKRDQGTILFRCNSGACEVSVSWSTSIQRARAQSIQTDSPVRKEDHDIRSLYIRDLLPNVGLEPCQRPAQCAPAATTNKQSLLSHEKFDRSIGLSIGRLNPVINGLGSAGQDVGNEIVSDALNNIRNTVVCFVIQRVGVGKNASFL